MMICRECGCEISDSAKFCLKCGTKVVKQEVNELKDEKVLSTEELQKGIQPEELPPINVPLTEELHVDALQADSLDSITIKIEQQTKEELKNEISEPVPREKEGQQSEFEYRDSNSERVEQKITFCPKCGMKNEGDSIFCVQCGYPLQEDMYVENQKNFNTQSQKPNEKKEFKDIKVKKDKKGKIGRKVIFTVFIAALAIGGFGVYKKLSEPRVNTKEPIAYIKGLNIFAVDSKSKKKESVQYTQSFCTDIDAISNLPIVTYSDNGKYVFYPDQSINGSFDLYYQNVKKGNESRIKLDSSVTEFKVLPDNSVVYKKGEDKILYIHDLKEKSKIASDVDEFKIDSKNQYILWGENSNSAGSVTSTLYYQDLKQKKDKQKIDTGVASLEISEDFTKIIYLKENNFYIVHNFGEKEMIDSDVSAIRGIDIEKENFYYIKEIKSKVVGWDFVEDDYAVSDASIQEPIRGNFIKERLEKVDGQYEKIQEEDEEAYDNAYEEYTAKLERDTFREALGDYEEERSTYELYNWSGGSAEKVDDGFISPNSLMNGTDAFVYSKYIIEENGKIKLSSLSEYSDVESAIGQQRSSSVVYCIAVGKNFTEIKDTKLIGEMIYDKTTKKFYGLANTASNEAANKELLPELLNESVDTALISIDTEGKNIGQVTLLQESVDTLEAVINGVIYCIGDSADGTGELYRNGEAIDSDVQSGSVHQIEGETSIIYHTDYNSERMRYTLKMYDNKDTTVISDDVLMYMPRSSKEIFVLMDYSVENKMGELKLYTGGEKLESLDTDVSLIIIKPEGIYEGLAL